ncbi:hypothetical protein [Halorientalis halophila]|uniref:hypothetical protein n=1 Tax=Halorientalis halophila TaxID=3108499 RepID=UPI00300AB4EB
MSDREESDLEADLSKKERLINAWIAVGPEGKTTDVSDLTGSSRGYASDIRRAIGGEHDDEEDDLPFEDVLDAYEPTLVETYRSELDEEAIDGEWPFTERLPAGESGESDAEQLGPPGPASGEPVPRSRAGASEPGATEQEAQPGRPSPPERQGRERQPQPPGREPSQPPGGAQPQPSQPQGTAQQPSQPQGPPPGASASQQPGAAERPSGWEPYSGSQAPGGPSQQPGGQPQSGQPPQQTGGRTRQPGGGGQPQQPGQGGQPQSQAGGAAQRQPQQARSQAQPQSQSPQQAPAGGGFRERLADLDNHLEAHQQQANAELSSVPQQSQAYAIAVSKYNLVVEVRQSLRDLAQFAPGP